jgi:serine/threonine protein kinase
MDTEKEANTEPIPGYRLLEPLGKGGFGEVWKCEAPGGLHKAIKFVSGGSTLITDTGGNDGAEQELRALEHVKSIRHPFLLSIERVEVIAGEMIMVMELADRSLHDLLVENRAAGQVGIPRDELLGYLFEAAEAIDLLNQEYNLQHLDIKPRNLFVIRRHVKVADFGLVASLNDLHKSRDGAPRNIAITPLYAAPETFLGEFSRYTDQYSLAISYVELLTGDMPFKGNFNQLALKHVSAPPDLSRLPQADRPVLLRALAKEPKDRYPSCLEFIQALSELSDVMPPRVARAQVTTTESRQNDLAATTPGANQVQTVQRVPPAKTAPAVSGLPTIVEPADPAAFLAGYQLLDCIQRQATAEVWKAQTADGRTRHVKLVNGYDWSQPRPDGDPLTRLRELRHANLLPIEAQRGPPGRFALITDAPDSTLHDRLREYQKNGQTGIERQELLDCLRDAAEALDELDQRQRLHHLGLTPRHLGLRADRLYLLDFSLMEILWLPAGHDPAALNTRYAAPELFAGQVSRHSDEYSLALIYQELLTGIHPFRNLNQRQMAQARQEGKADLALLPARDRVVIARALQAHPDKRYSSCATLIDALEEAGRKSSLPPSHNGSALRPSMAVTPTRSLETTPVPAALVPATLRWDRSLEEMKQIVENLITSASGDWEVRVRESMRYRLRRPHARSKSRGSASDSVNCALEYFTFGPGLPLAVRLRLAGFKEEGQAKIVEKRGGETDLASPAAEGPQGVSWVLQMELPPNFWERCRGKTPSLLARVELLTPPTTSQSMTDLVLRMSTTDCSPERGVELLEQYGVKFLKSLREHLQLPSEPRGEERIAYVETVRLYPLPGGREKGEGIAAQTKDVSRGGLGLFASNRPTTEHLLVQLSSPKAESILLPLQVMSTQPCGPGRYLLGTRFAWDLVEEQGSATGTKK